MVLQEIGGAGYDYISSTTPSSPNIGETWLDTSVDPPIGKVYADLGSGGQWTTDLLDTAVSNAGASQADIEAGVDSSNLANEIKSGRTRELLLLMQDKPVPEVVDPMNIQNSASLNIQVNSNDNIILESTATSGYVTDTFSAPTTPPADFQQWNAIRAEGVTTGGSTSTEPVKFDILQSPAEPWTSDSSLNTARFEHSSFFDGTYGYAVGGDDGSNTLASVERYDPSSGSWSSDSTLNNARSAHSSFFDGEKAYAVGGISGGSATQSVESYNPSISSATWQSVDQLSGGRRVHSSFFDGTYGYAVGGVVEGSITNSVERYDPTQNDWDSASTLSTARASHSSFFDGTYGYAVGGSDGSNTLASVERYDPSNDSWSNVASLNNARLSHSSFFDGRYGYAVGGDDGTNTLDSVERYDPSNDSWSRVESLNAVSESQSSFFDGTYGYSVGQYDGASPNASVERYGPESIYNTQSIPKAEIADSTFEMRNRVYDEGANSGQSLFTIPTTGDGGYFGIPILTVVSVKKNGSVLDSANWSFDDNETVTIDTSSVTINSGDTIAIKYDFDVFSSSLSPRAYLNREATSENSPVISHFRYEYVI